MTQNKKAPNYTKEQTAEMVERYEGCETEAERMAEVEKIAEDFGKTVRSVRQKLVRERVYVAKVYQTKTGNKPESKARIVSDIARTLGVAEESVESLGKANKTTLALIRGTLDRAKDYVPDSTFNDHS